MTEKPIRVAVVGVGDFGRNHVRVWSEMEGVELVGVVDTNAERAAYEALYPLLDAERDKLVPETDVAARTTTKPKRPEPTDFFQGLHLDHLEGKTRSSGDNSK